MYPVSFLDSKMRILVALDQDILTMIEEYLFYYHIEFRLYELIVRRAS